MQKYDYGETENQQRYGQATPPIYDLTKIRGPLALFFGLEDRLANPIDGKWLVGQLNSDSIVYLNQTLPIGHEGFLWGENMDYYSKVVEIALEYSKNQ